MASSCFRWRWSLVGDQVHVEVLAGSSTGVMTHAGALRMLPEEWEDLRLMLTPHANRNEVTYAGSRPQAIVEEDRRVATADQVADKGLSGMLGRTVLCVVCGADVPPQVRCPQCGALL
jgi:hypothetical protein